MSTTADDGRPIYDDRHQVPHLLSKSRWREKGLRPKDLNSPTAWVRWSTGDKPPYAVFAESDCEPIPQAPDRDQMRADRDRSADLARKLWHHAPAVVVDTETTSGTDARVIEVSAVAADGRAIVDQLVNPGRSIHPDAAAVHGIHDADLADAPTIETLAEQLETKLDGRTIIAWNGRFDQAALARTYRDAELEVPAWVRRDWTDAMQIHAAHRGEWDENHGRYRWHRLEGGHRAAGDCRAVWAKISAMAGYGPDPDTLAQLQQRWHARYDELAGMSGDQVASEILADLVHLGAPQLTDNEPDVWAS